MRGCRFLRTSFKKSKSLPTSQREFSDSPRGDLNSGRSLVESPICHALDIWDEEWDTTNSKVEPKPEKLCSYIIASREQR